VTRVEGGPGVETTPATDMAREAWRRMREMAHDPALMGKLHELAEEAKIIPGAAKALQFLSDDQELPMRRLASLLRCDNSYVTTIVDNLEEAGLARRETHPTDRRIKMIVLTDPGRRLAERVHELLRTPPPAFDLLDASDTATLERLMRKLTDPPLH
jgi:DNA-binding MarR family transcriptional regulator